MFEVTERKSVVIQNFNFLFYKIVLQVKRQFSHTEPQTIKKKSFPACITHVLVTSEETWKGSCHLCSKLYQTFFKDTETSVGQRGNNESQSMVVLGNIYMLSSSC